MKLADPKARPVRWSHLKRFSLSAAHYLASVTEPGADRATMRRGRLVHSLVLGGNGYVVFQGERRGKAWSAFAEEHAGHEIVTLKEYECASRAADAVRTNPIAMQLLEGRHEVPLEWELLGRRCSTLGVDVVAPEWVTELKTSTTSAPWRFSGLAIRSYYHAQLAWYLEALRQNGLNRDAGYIVAVEMAPPFAVTTFSVTPRALEAGNKLYRLWLERLLVCESCDEWPGYVQDTVPLDVPDDEPELLFSDDGEAA